MLYVCNSTKFEFKNRIVKYLILGRLFENSDGGHCLFFWLKEVENKSGTGKLRVGKNEDDPKTAMGKDL